MRDPLVPAGLLTVLCLALYVPGLSRIPPVDRDESRFAQSTTQMVETGDFIRPHFQAGTRFNKPVGIYWLQAAAVLVTRQRGRRVIWPYRLPSVAGAITAVLLTLWVGRRLFDARAALLGAALLACSALLVVEAHLATTDAVLLACVVAAQGCLAQLYAAGRRGVRGSTRYAAGFWIAQGLGILIKGPIVPLVGGLTLVTLWVADREGGTLSAPAWLRALHWKWGVPLMLALVLPWAVVAGWTTDWVFYRDWLGGDLLRKALGGQERHGAPPGSYLLVLGATFWPGSFVAGLAILQGVRLRAHRGTRFCLAWLVPTWIFFEAIPTKLPNYVMPTYPALALLVASAVLAVPGELSPVLRHWAARSGLVLWGLFTVAAGAAVVAAAIRLGSGPHLASLITALVAAAAAIVCVGFFWLGQPARAAWAAVIASVALFGPLLQWVIPDLQRVWLSRAAAAAMAQQSAGFHGLRPLATVGYFEPSLVFLAGANVSLVDPERVARFLKQRRDALVLVNDDERIGFTRVADAIGVQLREVWSTEGINYSTGQRARLRLFEQPGSAPLGADAAP